MGLNHSPRIVTDGLVMCLDAANRRSYPSSGTTWTDLSGNGNNGTLTNGPTFSNNTIVFDGTDDFVTLVSSSSFAYGTSDFTWEVVVNLTTYVSNHYVLDHGSNGGVIQYQNNTMRYYNPSTGVGSVLYTTGFGSNISTNTWQHLIAARISGTTYLYRNGVFTISATDSYNYPTQTVRIGNYGSGGSYCWNGNISLIRIYKGKGLSATEVQQNFNALRGRYGI